MAYRLDKRHQQDNLPADSNELDLSKVANVLIVFGLLSFLTSWVYSFEGKTIIDEVFRPSILNKTKEIGPIETKKYHEVYKIKVKAHLNQSWSAVNGKVLDVNKKHLFSFGKEVSHYSGRDSEGRWTEDNQNYSIDVSFKKPGRYYIQFDASDGKLPEKLKLKITKKRGSPIPHMVLGIILILAGIAIYELKNRMFRNTLGY